MNWYIEVLKKYAVFTGRSRRKEYWYFVLFSVLVSIILGVVDGIIGTYNEETGFGILAGVYSLAIILPSIAVAARRLHDIGRTGWWLLIGFIPIIGALVLLMFAVQDSQAGENQYGPWPKLD